MNAPQPDADACPLESIGHLKQKVCLMWGSAELDIFIGRLLMDSRDGARKGLPMPVGADLLFLAKTNKIIRAIDLMRSEKIQFKDAFRIVDEGDQKRLEADEFDNPLVSRDTVVKVRNEELRATRAQRPAPKPDGFAARIGHLVFTVLTSKAVLFLIAVALTVKLLWPFFMAGK
ncbi:MAG: hypothetical protein KKF85_09885 [Gammaproteobacteria bacterium]|nr:hypothetical protein [Rhodocyclaceae bacterium]MBU3909177.1 hypothetical protein [Gammaproteobacteria bacterium]MBU3990011.1 hypothetical protein [Gammaproteobacteria bacterium]MBU4005663.1 hypothetical protein [Gammaproteobacteria bacterium]MBU4020784.1 hypothetical protein [Gammaproteobacteria bacterium]